MKNNIQLLNKIAGVGLERLDDEKYTIGEDVENPVGIMVRSAVMHEMELPESLLAIARAGAGVNNIPIDKCTEKGICVFNTPGANANGVKELVICGLMLASRDVIGGVAWASALTENVAKSVEKGKSKFAGCEIAGKTLGVIGLGAIGAKVAGAATALGMNAVGCDPYLSVAGALKIDPDVDAVNSFDEIYKCADYITLHVPATPETKGMINSESIAKMKDGVKILNFARADLVNAEDLKAALESGKVSAYVTDFPTEEVIGVPGIVAIPHLGASTEEAEDNCAVMAADELDAYISCGNIRNSVNLPALEMPKSGSTRICVIHKSDISSQDVVASVSGNVIAMASKARGGVAYTIIDGDDIAADSLSDKEGIIRVRTI